MTTTACPSATGGEGAFQTQQRPAAWQQGVWRDRYLVVDNFVTREVAARMRADAHTLQRQGAPAAGSTLPPC